MTPSPPVLIVKGLEDESPVLSLETWCAVCERLISKHDIDGSELDRLETLEGIGAGLADQDIDAYNRHMEGHKE